MALRPRPLDVISLCTGGGGLDLALDLAVPGSRAVVVVEREAFAVAHLVAAMDAGLLAPAPVWSDVGTFDGRPWRGLVDGLIGGIPCQPHSLAGRKRGSLDERDLWSDTRRIIARARPWFVLIENVAGMLAAGADEIAGAERVWRDLRKLGFAVEAGLFRASEVGAPHERERLFILGLADTGCEPDERSGKAGELRGAAGATEGEGHQRQWHGDAARDGGADMADADDAGSQGRRGCFDPIGRQDPQRHARLGSGEMGDAEGRDCPGARQPEAHHADARKRQPRGSGRGGPLFPPGPADHDGWRGVLAYSPDLEPAVRRMADGLAARVDLSGPHAARVERLRMLGNGVVPLQGGYAIRALLARHAARGSARAAELLVREGAA
ncbi:DNA cytosine methyltransferase [Kaistia geumhonensis]|uniref:DNA cytosine methyltransferase n=1 Tax=Kaistia geumhonensis TaxID=410839 RepID=UPI003520ECAE